MTALKTHPELGKCLRPQTPKEREMLTASIKQDGCRDPLIVWDGFIVDGHNRHEVCEKLGVAYKTTAMDFADIYAAKQWIRDNQRARRNLEPIEMVRLLQDEADDLAENAKARVSANLPNAPIAPIGATGDTGKTAAKLAPEAGVSTRQYERLAKVIKDGTEELQIAVREKQIGAEEAAKIAREHHITPKELSAKAKAEKNKELAALAAAEREARIKAEQELEAKRAEIAAEQQRIELAAKTTMRRAKKEKKEQKEKDKSKELKLAVAEVNKQRRSNIEKVCDLRACSCADLFASGIKPDVVITDPPYPKAFIETFSELAAGCKAADVPIVAVMSGQSYLPEVMNRLCEHLQYRWTLAYLTPGGQAAQQWTAKANSFWKPILLFGNSVDWFGDVAKSYPNDNDKRFHGWGQSESGMSDLISRLSKPGDLVCDPFLGGGTTAVASLALGRRFVGCDIDKNNVEKSWSRLTV